VPGGSPYSPGGYTPPTGYDPTEFQVPEYEYVEEAYCVQCGKTVPNTAAVGQRCPHCGVIWTDDEASGAQRNSGTSDSGTRFRGRGFGKLVGGAIVLVIAVVGGLIRFLGRMLRN
jgi:predicted RNA-binding Zn-ribbon protein involved in translation (DUF1610 family)